MRGRLAVREVEAGGRQQHERDISAGPDRALLGEPQRRLEQRRIREEREDAADIAGDGQEIRIARAWMIGARKPALQQGAARRHQKEWDTHRDEQHAQQPPDRHPRCRRLAVLRRHDNRQREERCRQKHDVQNSLVLEAEPPRGRVCVKVSGQQHALEEDHAGVPDRRRSTEERQHHLGDHRLHDEEQR